MSNLFSADERNAIHTLLNGMTNAPLASSSVSTPTTTTATASASALTAPATATILLPAASTTPTTPPTIDPAIAASRTAAACAASGYVPLAPVCDVLLAAVGDYFVIVDAPLPDVIPELVI